MRIGILALAGLCLLATAAQAAGARLAWFQERTLFHSGLRGTHTLALTFDDGPNAHTGAVLDALKQYNIKATFFIVGRMAKAHPAMLARIAAEGHLLANHSATHALLGARYDNDPQLLVDQVRGVNDEIAPLMKPGDKLFFRAPYGAWRKAHAAILNADPVLRNYTGPIYWDIGGEIAMHDGYVMSSADWSCWRRHWTAQVCGKGYLREIRRENGGVVLMHCIYRESGDLVADMLPALIGEGYKFVRLDQMPAYTPYETPPAPPSALADTPLDTTTRLASNDVK